MIQTINLQLIPVERIHIEAFLRSKGDLAALLQVAVPDSWPTFPEAFSLPDEAYKSDDWHGYFFLHPQEKLLVGNGGFTGEPDEVGIVEIGYEIASEYWNRGFGTEAARGMMDFAFTHAPVNAVIAHTLAEPNASNRLLQKLGMKFVEEINDPENGKIWRWQITREDYQSR